MQNSLSCLKEAVASQLDNLYTTALLSYTFTLAGDQEMRSKLITYLHQKSNTQSKTETIGNSCIFQQFFPPKNHKAVNRKKKFAVETHEIVEILKKLEVAVKILILKVGEKAVKMEVQKEVEADASVQV